MKMNIALASSFEYANYDNVVLQSLFDNNSECIITVYFDILMIG